MTTIEKELANAYGEVIDAEIEATLASAEPDMPELSPEFKKKMEELIRTGKPNNKKKGLSKRGKRILLIAIAAVLALTLTACAVAEWESIAGFFVKIFSDHVEYSDPDVTKERIEEEYGLIPIPDGFAITSTDRAETSYIVTYSDAEQNLIILRQAANLNAWLSVDSEYGSYSEYELDDKIVRLYCGENSFQATWLQDGYLFSLTYTSAIDLETFESWIMLVRKG